MTRIGMPCERRDLVAGVDGGHPPVDSVAGHQIVLFPIPELRAPGIAGLGKDRRLSLDGNVARPRGNVIARTWQIRDKAADAQRRCGLVGICLP